MADDKTIMDKASQAVDQGGKQLGRTVGGPLGEVVSSAGGFLGKALGWLQDGHNWMKTNMPGPYKIGLLLLGAPLLMRVAKGGINAFGNMIGSEKLMGLGNQKGFMGGLVRTGLFVGAALGVNALVKKGFGEKSPGAAHESEAAQMRRKALGLDQENQSANTPTNEADVQAGAKTEAEADVKVEKEQPSAADPDAGTEIKVDENRKGTSAFQMERDEKTPDVSNEFNKAGQNNGGQEPASENEPAPIEEKPGVDTKQPELVNMAP